MRLRSKNSLDLSKYMSLDCLPISRGKSLALKTINEIMDDSSEEDDREKEVAFLEKKFKKFLKMKNSGKLFSKRKFSSPKGDRKEFKKKDGKDSQTLKEMCAMNATVIDIARRSVPTI